MEETGILPKPMVQIGDKPILWHIMKYYSSFGFNEFVVLLGYKGYQIKEYFANYALHQNDVAIDLGSNRVSTFKNNSEPWKITLLETGQDTMTGSRIKMAAEHIDNQTFMLTYGDGLADVDLHALIETHKHNAKALTVTAVQPESRFGILSMDELGNVASFTEKPADNGSWINGGFFVCEPKILDYIADGADIVFEQQPMRDMAQQGQMHAYRHYGGWKCMDTQRDNLQLNDLWNRQKAFWKVWK